MDNSHRKQILVPPYNIEIRPRFLQFILPRKNGGGEAIGKAAGRLKNSFIGA